jgi:DNA-binding NarL/FixJ family response regulator
MFYKELAEIANQLNRDELDIDGVLKAVCMRKFGDRRFLASFFLGIEQDGRLTIKGYFGASPQEIGITDGALSIFDDHPASLSIRQDSMVCRELSFRKSASIKPIVIAWPVESNARILGSIVLITDSRCDSIDENREFLDALALLINNTLSSRLDRRNPRSNSKSNGNGPHPEKLSERQEVILKLIAEGRTNGDIAEILGYSESLIRQETIKIYAILNCNGRQEAAQTYLSRFGATSTLEY